MTGVKLSAQEAPHSPSSRGLSSEASALREGSEVRVVVVDDSAVARGMWVRALTRSSAVKVVTSFNGGQPFLDWLSGGRESAVDVVVLDIEMPGMSGLDALPAILAKNQKIKVIIASAHSPAGSANAVKALMLGAADFVCKPSSLSPGAGLASVEGELLEKVLRYREVKGGDAEGRGVPIVKSVAHTTQREPPGKSAAPALLVVGSSTGGPQALLKLFSLLPKPLRLPVLIAQHMPPRFTTLLAASIAEATGHPCREAADGDVLVPGQILMAPGDFHLQVKRSPESKLIKVELNQNPPENWCRPAVDPLFRSAAECFGSRLLALVLTGMGEDGRRGAEAIRQCGGVVLAQDEASSVVWGMPGAVARAGIASEVLSIAGLASRVTRACQPANGIELHQFAPSPQVGSKK